MIFFLVVQRLADVLAKLRIQAILLRPGVQIRAQALEDMVRGDEVVLQLELRAAPAGHVGSDIIPHSREVALIEAALQFGFGAGGINDRLAHAFFYCKIVQAALIHRQISF